MLRFLEISPLVEAMAKLLLLSRNYFESSRVLINGEWGEVGTCNISKFEEKDRCMWGGCDLR